MESLKVISEQTFKEVFSILIENMKTYNKQLIIKKNDFDDWKSNIYCICEIQIKNEKQKDKKTFRKLISYLIDVYDIDERNI